MVMNKKVFLTAVLSLLTVPVLSFAQPGVFSGNIYDVVNLIILYLTHHTL